MQFKKELENFKQELLSNLDTNTEMFQIDFETDKFLESKGISLNLKEEEEIDE